MPRREVLSPALHGGGVTLGCRWHTGRSAPRVRALVSRVGRIREPCFERGQPPARFEVPRCGGHGVVSNPAQRASVCAMEGSCHPAAAHCASSSRCCSKRRRRGAAQPPARGQGVLADANIPVSPNGPMLLAPRPLDSAARAHGRVVHLTSGLRHRMSCTGLYFDKRCFFSEKYCFDCAEPASYNLLIFHGLDCVL